MLMENEVLSCLVYQSTAVTEGESGIHNRFTPYTYEYTPSLGSSTLRTLQGNSPSKTQSSPLTSVAPLIELGVQ